MFNADTLEKKELKTHIILIIFCFIFFTWIFVRNIWASDDGFISMRVVDNFVNGYGLVWNVGERVQAFTHPLWVLVIIPFYAIIKDPYWTIFIVSFLVTSAAILVVFLQFAKTNFKLVLFTLLITMSASFIDYSSSGLENPLSHLLLVVFLTVWLQKPLSIKTLFLTSLIASLAAVNRLDTILFYIPVILLQLYELRKDFFKAILAIVLGFIPLFLWEGFSLFYYGFPFPNTYYAKVAGANLSLEWVLYYGWGYFINSFQWDPITLATIILGTIFVLLKPDRKRIALIVGVYSYLGYVLSVGGDFMSGRFFSIAFLAIVIIFVSSDHNTVFRNKVIPKKYVLIGIILVVGLFSKYPPILISHLDFEDSITEWGQAHEKLFYFNTSNIYARIHHLPEHKWAIRGKVYHNSGKQLIYIDTIGFSGYYAGPDVYIVDILTLADPLRARIIPDDQPRIGHLPREVPEGYDQTILNNFENHLVNPDLYYYYNKLDILIHDNLISKTRFFEIINMNLGKYDHWIDHYNESKLDQLEWYNQ